MSTTALPTGPDPEAITREILERYPETVVAEAMGATFFSLDEKHWPNYVTIVTTDDHDEGAPSDLARPGVFRLNIGIGRATFERLVGSIDAPDYAALDRVLPHPRLRETALDLDSQPRRRDIPRRGPAADRRGARPAREEPRPASERPADGMTTLARRLLRIAPTIER